MQFYYISTAFNTLATCATAVLCFASRPLSKIDKWFAYLSLCTAFWSSCAAFQSLFGGWDSVLLWRISLLGIIAVPPVLYGFAVNLSGKIKSRVLMLKILAASAIFVAAADMTPFLIKGTHLCGPLPGPAFALVVIYFIAGAIPGLRLMKDHYRGLAGFGAKEAGYLLISCIVLLAGIFSNFLFWYGIKSTSYGNILVTIGIAAGFAFAKYGISEISLMVTRAGIFTVLYAVILGVPFWFGSVTLRWKFSVMLMGILASIGPFIYNLIGRKVKNVLLSQQRRYQHILLEISQSMTKEHDLNKLVKFIVYAIKRAVKIEFAAIFVNSAEDKAFVLKAVKDTGRLHPKFFFSYTHPLIIFLKEHKRPVTIDELPRSLDGFKEIDLGMRLIVPSFVDERLVCFLLLGDKLDKTNYSEDDINIFLTLSSQAAVAMENCMYLKEFEKAQEKIFNANKLSSLGGMADGVAHQIKNRLNQFSVAAGEQQYEIKDFRKNNEQLINATPDLKKTLEYLEEIASSMLDNVKKTSNVIQGVLGFARVEENGTSFSEFHTEEIIRPTLDLLCVKHQITAFPLTVAAGSTPPVYGMKSQVMECLYNILDNSYEAIREKIDYHLKVNDGFKPEIFLNVTKKERSSFVEVSDNGIGIKEENMNKIFAPFFTTKSSFKSGSGVGMYVVKRMIEENHKGKVKVESEYMKGTKVSLELPDKV